MDEYLRGTSDYENKLVLTSDILLVSLSTGTSGGVVG